MTDPYANSAWNTSGTPAGTPSDDVRQTVSNEGQAVAETAKYEASNVAESARQSTQRVAETAKSEAADVASHAKDQIRSLATNATDELRGRAWDTHSFATQNIRSLSGEVSSLLNGEPVEGPVRQVVETVQQKGESLATWLENSDPSDVVDEVRRFAARRPWAFMAIAAGAGLVVGRLARGTKDSQDETAQLASPSKDYYARRRAELSSQLGSQFAAPAYSSVDAATTPGYVQPGYEPESGYPVQPGVQTQPGIGDHLVAEDLATDDRFGLGERPETERY